MIKHFRVVMKSSKGNGYLFLLREKSSLLIRGLSIKLALKLLSGKKGNH